MLNKPRYGESHSSVTKHLLIILCTRHKMIKCINHLHKGVRLLSRCSCSVRGYRDIGKIYSNIDEY